jgi:hypothetical protein
MPKVKGGRLVLTEKEFQQQVVNLARSFYYLVYHTFDSRRSAPGFTDLVLVRSPRVLFVELKSEGGKLTPSQKLWALELKACPGVEYYCWYPDDLQEIAEVLSR